MTFAIHARLQAAAEVHDLPLEPLEVRTFDLWDGTSRTILGYQVTGEASQEHLWIRALEHWRPTRLTLHEGLWWPPSEPLGGLHPEQGDEGPRMVLGALGTEALKAMTEDLNATLAWLEEQRERQVRFTTRSALERVQGELEEFLQALESLAAPTHSHGESRSHTQARFGDRVHERLAHRLTALEALGAEPDHRTYEARLESELQAIRDHELQALFYVLADLGTQARANFIRLGPGRGALPSSLVAWLLGVTDIDPVAHGLIFERWLGEEEIARRRVTLEAAPEQAEALGNWARNRSRRGEAIVTVLPSPLMAHLERAHRIAGLKRTPHPAWHPHDMHVFEAIQSGLLDTSGLDSEGLETNIFPIHPTTFHHLRDWTALGHPWGLGRETLLAYVDRRMEKALVPPSSGCLSGPLSGTFGLLLYQEQVIQILCEATGCSLFEGDHLRRDLASGNPIRLKHAQQRCLEIGKERGWSPQELRPVLDLLEERSRWTFCRSHASARAALAYEVGWWKVHHRDAFDRAGLDTQAEGTQTNNHRYGKESE